MLASIHPLGERARGNRWWLTATAYISGSVIGGTLLATALAPVGRLVGSIDGKSPAAPLAIGSAACLVAALIDIVGRRGPNLPTIRRQVNEDWLSRYRGWIYGAGFGVQLGVGLATIVTTASIYLMAVLTITTGWTARNWTAALASGAAIGATFGLSRAIPLLLGSSVKRPEQLRRIHRRLARAERLAGLVTIASMTVAGAVLGRAAAT